MNLKKINLILRSIENLKLVSGQLQKILDLDGSTPEPAVLSSDTGQRIPCFDSFQLIITLMSNMYALGTDH